MTPDASLPPTDMQRPTPPLTEEELAEIEQRASAATLGPWEPFDSSGRTDDRGFPMHNSVVTAGFPERGWCKYGFGGADAEFIAHARTDVPRLIADLRASRERIKELEAEVEEWKQAHRSEVGY